MVRKSKLGDFRQEGDTSVNMPKRTDSWGARRKAATLWGNCKGRAKCHEKKVRGSLKEEDRDDCAEGRPESTVGGDGDRLGHVPKHMWPRTSHILGPLGMSILYDYYTLWDHPHLLSWDHTFWSFQILSLSCLPSLICLSGFSFSFSFVSFLLSSLSLSLLFFFLLCPLLLFLFLT